MLPNCFFYFSQAHINSEAEIASWAELAAKNNRIMILTVLVNYVWGKHSVILSRGKIFRDNVHSEKIFSGNSAFGILLIREKFFRGKTFGIFSSGKRFSRKKFWANVPVPHVITPYFSCTHDCCHASYRRLRFDVYHIIIIFLICLCLFINENTAVYLWKIISPLSVLGKVINIKALSSGHETCKQFQLLYT